MVIKGGSGLGKSVLSRSIVANLLREGVPFIEVMTKYYKGELKLLMDQFLKSVGSFEADVFLSRCRAIDLRVILLIDGLNECPGEHLRKLGHEIDALVNTTPGRSASLVTDTLHSVHTPLKVSEVSVPSVDEKRLIAASHGRLDPEAEGLLKLAQTGLEASLVGKIATQVPKPESRAELYSRYVNERLSADAIGIDARDVLRRVASAIHERLALVAPRADLQRLVLSRPRPGDIEARLWSSGLLGQSFASISFPHELWKDFFAGEALALTQTDPPAFASELFAR